MLSYLFKFVSKCDFFKKSNIIFLIFFIAVDVWLIGIFCVANALAYLCQFF